MQPKTNLQIALSADFVTDSVQAFTELGAKTTQKSFILRETAKDRRKKESSASDSRTGIYDCSLTGFHEGDRENERQEERPGASSFEWQVRSGRVCMCVLEQHVRRSPHRCLAKTHIPPSIWSPSRLRLCTRSIPTVWLLHWPEEGVKVELKPFFSSNLWPSFSLEVFIHIHPHEPFSSPHPCHCRYTSHLDVADTINLSNPKLHHHGNCWRGQHNCLAHPATQPITFSRSTQPEPGINAIQIQDLRSRCRVFLQHQTEECDFLCVCVCVGDAHVCWFCFRHFGPNLLISAN